MVVPVLMVLSLSTLKAKSNLSEPFIIEGPQIIAGFFVRKFLMSENNYI